MRPLDRRSSSNGRYSNPCLTMHQPWASLLVHGIKRVEGRSWPSPITGRLWIHAASKVPDPETIRAMEDFYREIYAVNGITDIKFPEHYPVSRLLGCVQVVGCVRSQELVSWEHVPESVRLEGLTDFCWLCENPQKLVVPFEMGGYQGVYNLERRVYDGAVRGLSPVQGPQPVKFPLPDPRDPSSLKPGSLTSDPPKSAVQNSESVAAAIAGARAAATQFSRKDHNAATSGETHNFRENRVDSSSGNGSPSSVSQGSPSSVAQGCLSYVKNQNQPSISQDSRSIAQDRLSYVQNQNQPSISQDSRPIAQGRLSYMQNQNRPYIFHDSRPIAQGSPSYLQNQNQPYISHDSRSIGQGSPYPQNPNRPSIYQNTPAYLRNLNTEPRTSPRLQNGAPNRLVAVALRELKQSSDSERERQSSLPRSSPGQHL